MRAVADVVDGVVAVGEVLGLGDTAGQVGVGAVDAGVEDGDLHALAVVALRPGLGGADLRHALVESGLDLGVEPDLADAVGKFLGRRPVPGGAQARPERPGVLRLDAGGCRLDAGQFAYLLRAFGYGADASLFCTITGTSAPSAYPCAISASTSKRRASRAPEASSGRASSGITVMFVPYCSISALPPGLPGPAWNMTCCCSPLPVTITLSPVINRTVCAAAAVADGLSARNCGPLSEVAPAGAAPAAMSAVSATVTGNEPLVKGLDMVRQLLLEGREAGYRAGACTPVHGKDKTALLCHCSAAVDIKAQGRHRLLPRHYHPAARLSHQVTRGHPADRRLSRGVGRLRRPGGTLGPPWISPTAQGTCTGPQHGVRPDRLAALLRPRAAPVAVAGTL